MMERLNLYPEMNKEIINILRLTEDNPMNLYAAQLIEEQAEEITAMKAELEGYREAERDGRFIKMPVKIKDVVYIHQGSEVRPMIVEYMQWGGLEMCFTAECMDQSEGCSCGENECCTVRFSKLSMANRIFLTRKEAEDAFMTEKSKMDESISHNMPEDIRDRFRESYSGQPFRANHAEAALEAGKESFI